MRNSYIMPVLFRIQLMEVECFQEIQCQQGTAETAMLFLRKHLVFLTFRKKIGIVDFSFLIDCDGSGNTAVRPFCRSVEQGLQCILLYHNIRLHDYQTCLRLDGTLLCHLQYQQIVRRGMVRYFRKIYQFKAQLFGCILQLGRVFFCTEVIIYGIGKRRLKIGCNNGFHRLQRQFNGVLYRSNDMNTLHWI